MPADEAFVFKASVVNDKVVLDWKIAQGYYLYKEKIKSNFRLRWLCLYIE